MIWNILREILIIIAIALGIMIIESCMNTWVYFRKFLVRAIIIRAIIEICVITFDIYLLWIKFKIENIEKYKMFPSSYFCFIHCHHFDRVFCRFYFYIFMLVNNYTIISLQEMDKKESMLESYNSLLITSALKFYNTYK